MHQRCCWSCATGRLHANCSCWVRCCFGCRARSVPSPGGMLTQESHLLLQSAWHREKVGSVERPDAACIEVHIGDVEGHGMSGLMHLRDQGPSTAAGSVDPYGGRHAPTQSVHVALHMMGHALHLCHWFLQP